MFSIKNIFKKKTDLAKQAIVNTSKPKPIQLSPSRLDKISISKTETKFNFLGSIKNILKKKNELQVKKSMVQPEKTAPDNINVKQKKFDLFNKIKSVFKKKEDKLHMPHPEGRIEFFKKKLKKERQIKISSQARRQRMKSYIDRAGLDISTQKLSKIFFNITVLINLLLSGYLVYYFSITYGITWGTIILSMIVLWVFIFVFLIFAIWIMFYLAVDLRIFKRKLDIEDVLPDFLQLTASNINAGMTIDRALWFAVRPRFGVLAKEIESIAKDTMTGADLKSALEKFAAKYNSIILKRSISMLNEGIEAGGKIGDLLNRIATDVQEQKSVLKEMSANVTTYVIFIAFATIVATPFLFSLSGVLISVVQQISSGLGSTGNVAAISGIPLSFSGVGITQTDFKIFAIVSLMLSSFFSASMISTIRNGNIKSGMKYIPIFIIVSLTIFFVALSLLESLISLFF